MSNFFELSESKKKSLSISELSNYAQRFNIEVQKISDKTGKKINKKKEELINELNTIYLKNKIQEKKKNEDKKPFQIGSTIESVFSKCYFLSLFCKFCFDFGYL